MKEISVPRGRLELPTYRSSGGRSNQLSYLGVCVPRKIPDAASYASIRLRR